MTATNWRERCMQRSIRRHGGVQWRGWCKGTILGWIVSARRPPSLGKRPPRGVCPPDAGMIPSDVDSGDQLARAVHATDPYVGNAACNGAGGARDQGRQRMDGDAARTLVCRI